MVVAFGFALVMSVGAYWFSDAIALKMAGAREVTAAEVPKLHSVVAQLARRAGLPLPRVYFVDDPTPNAFATGRDPAHAAVAATTGLLRILDRDELAGVSARLVGGCCWHGRPCCGIIGHPTVAGCGTRAGWGPAREEGTT